MNLPNKLTVLRIALIPVCVALLSVGRTTAAAIVFAAAAFTDFLDGYIARKHNLITNFGKLMDPLADKLMVLSVMLSQALKGYLPWLPLIILFVKELLMVLGGAFMLRKKIVVYSQSIGKIAQTFVVSALILTFFKSAFESIGVPIHLIVLWIAVALTLAALVFYAKNAWKNYKEAK